MAKTIDQLELIKLIFLESYGDYFNLLRAYKDDKCSVRYNFSSLVDTLNKDNEVTSRVAQNIDLVSSKDKLSLKLVCGSIKLSLK